MFYFPWYLFVLFYTCTEFEILIATKIAFWMCELGILYVEVPANKVTNVLISMYTQHMASAWYTFDLHIITSDI
jgi:hypothetical protein